MTTAIPDPTDLDLLDAFRRRADQGAFAALVERHGGWVYGLCLRATGRAIEADEACQDAFLELARSANRVRERVPAWLHTVARRCAARIVARRSSTSALPDDLPAQQAQRADLAHLDESLAELDADLRAVLVARFLAGLSQDAVAERLGVSQATVSRRLADGLARMRTALDRRGVALGAAPAGLLAQVPAGSPPATVVEALGRVALIARPALVKSTIPLLILAGFAVVIGVAATLWALLPWPQTPRMEAVVDDPPRPTPAPRVATAAGELGWTVELTQLSPSAVDVRRAVGSSRRVAAMAGTAIGRIGWSNRTSWQSAPKTFDLIDATGQVRRIGPFESWPSYGARWTWDPCGGVPSGAWDAPVREAARDWQRRPEDALAALDRALGVGCPRSELSVLGVAAAANAGHADEAAAWYAAVPADRGDQWFADVSLHAALRALGRLAQAREPLSRLHPSLGILPGELDDVAAIPAWPGQWHALTDLGPELGQGSAHLWDAGDAALRSQPLDGPIAVEARGDCFTALRGLARPLDQVAIYLQPVAADGTAAPAGHHDCVGWQCLTGTFEFAFDGSGSQIPRLGTGDGTIDLRILADGKTCAVWVGGRLRAVAPQRHHGQWRLVIEARSRDLYLPRFLVRSPSAAAGADLLSAIRDDDAYAVRRRLAAGDEPTRPFPGGNESPLSFAADGDRCQAITALLEDQRVKIDAVDASGGTALYRAVDNLALAAAKLLLERGAKPSPLNRWGTTPLAYACRSAQPELVELLLAHGAEVAIETSGADHRVGAAIDRLGPGPSAAAVVAAFRRHGKPITARAQAIGGDPVGAATALVDDARRASEGPGLLAAAVLLDDAALVHRCLEAGVPVDALDPGNSMTGLQLALGITGNPDIAQELAARGADLNAPGNRGTARALAQGTGFPLEILAPSPTQPPKRGDF